MSKFGFLKALGMAAIIPLVMLLVVLPLIILGLWYTGRIGFEPAVIVLLLIAIYGGGSGK